MQDKLTVNESDQIVAASGSDISAGNYFERIDMYVHYALDFSTQAFPNDGEIYC